MSHDLLISTKDVFLNRCNIYPAYGITPKQRTAFPRRRAAITRAPTGMTVLNATRAQNIAIVLRVIRLPITELRHVPPLRVFIVFHDDFLQIEAACDLRHTVHGRLLVHVHSFLHVGVQVVFVGTVFQRILILARRQIIHIVSLPWLLLGALCVASWSSLDLEVQLLVVTFLDLDILGVADGFDGVIT